MINLYGTEFNKLQDLLVNNYGQKPYRVTQLYSWIYEKEVNNFDDMSDISKAFRDTLKKEFSLEKPKIHIKQESKDGTIKFLTKLNDGALVETVIMPYNYGSVLCVSSQVGCNMGCSFCASGLLGKQRNLETSEMVGELLLANDILKEKDKRITHIVIMGTGEPFDNYDNVIDFVKIVNHPHAFAIGARHITISTCGIPDKIKSFAELDFQVNLAISLHAPTNEIRNKIMKINKAYPLEKVMDAVRFYESNKGRRVTFEYILLHKINDDYECAKNLANLIKGTLAYVNLIPYNEVKENEYKRSKNINQFHDWLIKLGVNATVRKEFGSDIDAACGQLRAKQK